MHELLISRGFVRRADAPDLAEVKEREAATEAAAALARKERAEAAARRRLEKKKDTKLNQEDVEVHTTVVPVLCVNVVFRICLLEKKGACQGVASDAGFYRP